MKAKWVNIVDSLQGNVDQRHYARRIPGNGEWAAVCAKPELSKKTKKAKAEHPMSTRSASDGDSWKKGGGMSEIPTNHLKEKTNSK